MAEETQPPAGQEGQSAGKPAPVRTDPYKNFKFMVAAKPATPAERGADQLRDEGSGDKSKGR